MDHSQADRQTPAPSGAAVVFQRTFASLGHRNYRIWFWSQMFSFFGSWMQSTSIGYLMFELTQSATWLGWMSFASGLPNILFLMYGGLLCDRYPKQRIIFLAESAMAVISLATAILILTGAIRPWHLLVTAALMGLANAFDTPGRQSFVSELVPRDDLSNAIALGATQFNTAVALGPAIGGVIYAIVGPGWCFLINAVSFTGVLGGLFFMRFADEPKRLPRGGTMESVRRSAAALLRGRDMRTILLAMANGVLFGMALMSLLPAWVQLVLHGDSRVNGLLQSFRGLGALAGALLLASRGRFDRKPALMTVATLLYPVTLILFSWTGSVFLSSLCLVLAGVCQIHLFNLCNAMTQMLTPFERRGTIMGMYNLVFTASSSLGGLLAGHLADSIRLRPTFLVMAGISFFVAAVNLLSNRGFRRKRI